MCMSDHWEADHTPVDQPVDHTSVGHHMPAGRMQVGRMQVDHTVVAVGRTVVAVAMVGYHRMPAPPLVDHTELALHTVPADRIL